MAAIAHDVFAFADRHTFEKDPYPGKDLLWYRVTKVAGQNADTITYLCKHLKENRPAVIKEYFPARLARRRADGIVVLCHDASIADFNRGLEIFIADAENLERLNHPNIAKVLDVFETNGTGYMARGYEQGRTLAEMLASGVTFGESELREILRCIIEGLAEIHKYKLTCRDLGSANIVVRPDGSAVLLVSVAVIGTIAHRPLWTPVSSLAGTAEQIDPWADIRAAGAILFRAVSGSVGTAAGARIKDANTGLVSVSIPAVEAGRGRYSQQFLQLVDHLRQPDLAGHAPYTEEWYRKLALKNLKSGKLQEAVKTPSSEQQGVRWSRERVSLRELLGRRFATPSAYLARMKPRAPLHGHLLAVTVVLIAFSAALIASIDRNRRTDINFPPVYDVVMNWRVKIPIFYGFPSEINTQGDSVLQRIAMGIKIPMLYDLPPEIDTQGNPVLQRIAMRQPQHQADVLPHPLQASPLRNQHRVLILSKHEGNSQSLAARGHVGPLDARDYARRANSRDPIERLQRPESREIALPAKRTASRNTKQPVVKLTSQTRLNPPITHNKRRRHSFEEGQAAVMSSQDRDSRLDKIKVDGGRAELPEPFERTEKTERPEVARLERPEPVERIERLLRPEIERIERLLRPERIERVERLLRPERIERVERLLRPERIERIERLVRPERIERIERLVRPERIERIERLVRPERIERIERLVRPERIERIERLLR